MHTAVHCVHHVLHTVTTVQCTDSKYGQLLYNAQTITMVSYWTSIHWKLPFSKFQQNDSETSIKIVYVYTCRGHKHFSEVVHSKRSVSKKMYSTKHDAKPWQWFLKNNPAILVKILPLAPIAEFCASPMDNSTTFGIFELGTLHGSIFHWCLVRSLVPQ